MDWEVLISEEEINNRITELAKEIDKDYDGKEVIAIVIMNGAMFFATSLTMKMKTPVSFEFKTLKSYIGEKTSGKIEEAGTFNQSLKDKDVLIIEDLVDTGLSMHYFIEKLKEEEKPASIKLCTLVHKIKPKEEIKYDIHIDYNGFDIPDKFIIGYGMDYNEKYRNLPYIADKNNKLVRRK